MTEKPILFSAEMIRALLEDRKTQTRRVVKGDYCFGANGAVLNMRSGLGRMECPYGEAGDRLWVREAFCRCGCDGCIAAWPKQFSNHEVTHRATHNGPSGYSWKPSIHMPRWASRITLEIKQVRVERIQEISEADAKAEGVKAHPDIMLNVASDGYRTSFRHTWTVLNAKRGFGWDANPFVWVISFERME